MTKPRIRNGKKIRNPRILKGRNSKSAMTASLVMRLTFRSLTSFRGVQTEVVSQDRDCRPHHSLTFYEG
jgi:hypothetical protein